MSGLEVFGAVSSVFGLVQVAGKTTKLLYEFISSVKDAPSLAANVAAETEALIGIFGQLHTLLCGKIRRAERAEKLYVDKIVATISGSMRVFSDLEKELVQFNAATNSFAQQSWERIKWAWKEEEFRKILENLQRQKLTISLMLSIFNCESDVEAQKNSETLEKLVREGLARDEFLLKKMEDFEKRLVGLDDIARLITTQSCPPSRKPWMNDHDLREGTFERSESVRASMASTSFKLYRPFESALYRTRVYTRVQEKKDIDLDRSYASSVVTGQSAWTHLSDISLAQISNISVLGVPLCMDDLFNSEYYQLSTATIEVSQRGVQAPTITHITEDSPDNGSLQPASFSRSEDLPPQELHLLTRSSSTDSMSTIRLNKPTDSGEKLLEEEISGKTFDPTSISLATHLVDQTRRTQITTSGKTHDERSESPDNDGYEDHRELLRNYNKTHKWESSQTGSRAPLPPPREDQCETWDAQPPYADTMYKQLISMRGISGLLEHEKDASYIDDDLKMWLRKRYMTTMPLSGQVSKIHVHGLKEIYNSDQGIIFRTGPCGSCAQYLFNLPGSFLTICDDLLNEAIRAGETGNAFCASHLVRLGFYLGTKPLKSSLKFLPDLCFGLLYFYGPELGPDAEGLREKAELLARDEMFVRSIWKNMDILVYFVNVLRVFSPARHDLELLLYGVDPVYRSLQEGFGRKVVACLEHLIQMAPVLLDTRMAQTWQKMPSISGEQVLLKGLSCPKYDTWLLHTRVIHHSSNLAPPEIELIPKAESVRTRLVSNFKALRIDSSKAVPDSALDEPLTPPPTSLKDPITRMRSTLKPKTPKTPLKKLNISYPTLLDSTNQMALKYQKE